MDEHVIDPCSAKRLPKELPTDPLRWARAWLDEAVAKQVQRNPNTMTAITVNEQGQPSGRQVLCKDFVEDPGYLVFYAVPWLAVLGLLIARGRLDTTEPGFWRHAAVALGVVAFVDWFPYHVDVVQTLERRVRAARIQSARLRPRRARAGQRVRLDLVPATPTTPETVAAVIERTEYVGNEPTDIAFDPAAPSSRRNMASAA